MLFADTLGPSHLYPLGLESTSAKKSRHPSCCQKAVQVHTWRQLPSEEAVRPVDGWGAVCSLLTRTLSSGNYKPRGTLKLLNKQWVSHVVYLSGGFMYTYSVSPLLVSQPGSWEVALNVPLSCSTYHIAIIVLAAMPRRLCRGFNFSVHWPWGQGSHRLSLLSMSSLLSKLQCLPVNKQFGYEYPMLITTKLKAEVLNYCCYQLI